MPPRTRESAQLGRPVAGRGARLPGWCAGGALIALLLGTVPPAHADDSQAPAASLAKSRSAEGPIAPGAGEAAYWARLDMLLAPLTGLQVAQADLDRVKQASAAIAKGDVVHVLALASEIKHRAARTIVEWMRLRAGHGSAAEIESFLDANPDWPERGTLTQRLEEALLTSESGAATARARFAGRKPETGAGLGALAAAHLAAGDTAKAKVLAAEAWRKHDMSAAVESRFLAQLKPLLTEADHRWRLDRVLMSDRRWTGERNAQAAIAKRIVPLLSPAEQKKANARIAVYLRAKSAAKDMAALPAETTPDWGLVFQRIQLLRRAEKIDEAAKLLLSAPTDPASIVSPDDWWDERRALAYEALAAGKPKLAYELVREAGPLGENPIKDQRFMAGWLAMRQLGDVKRAEAHFRALRKAADGPLSRAKGDYWIGRALEAKGAKGEAMEAYRAAARERDTFHGQLARQKLEPGRARLEVKPPAEPPAAEVERFIAIAPAEAAIVAHKAGLGGAYVRPLLVNLRTRGKSESWSAMTAHLAKRLGDNQMSLRLAKAAIADGHDLLLYAYPVHAFPSYTPLTPPPETAMLLGIARQETEFNASIVSGAGARGILQVMPVTARHVCRDYKLKCDIPRLLTDTSYNTMMASAYIGDRMREFGGNYVLTLAGYNAGPGRARQWMQAFGDPRDPKVDAIDWIERIPFEETRGYVAKVLSNIQVYRARLGLEAPLRLEEDLGLNRKQARNTDQQGGSRQTASGE